MKGLIFLLILGYVYGAPPSRDQDLCGACYMLMGEVQTMVTDGATQEAVQNYASDVCTKLSSEDKDVCKLFLQVGSANVFKRLLLDVKPQQFCENMIEVCPRETELSRPIEQPRFPVEEVEEEGVEGPLECELCKLAILAVDRLIKNNKSEAAINATLTKFCMSLPDKLSPICTQVEPLILKALENGLPPGEACKLVKLCLTSEMSVYEPAVSCDVCLSVMEGLGFEDFQEVCDRFPSCVEKVEPEPEVVNVIQEGQIEDPLQCQICKFVVQAIDKLVGENATRAEINETLIQLCNGLPGEIKDACMNAEPEILNAIINGIEPSKACDFIKACNDDVSLNVVTCSMCKEALESFAGEEGVEVCYQLTSVCSEPERKMDEMLAPPSVEQVEEPEEIETVGDDARCELCQLLVTYIDNIVQDNVTLGKLNATLIEACGKLPAAYKDICAGIVPTLVNAIAQGVDPKYACEEAKFCPKEQSAELEISCSTCQALTDLAGFSESKSDEFCKRSCSARVGRSLMSIKTSNTVECELCRVLIRTLDLAAKENATKEQVNTTLFEVCERLTGDALQKVCEGTVPKVLSILDTGVDPVIGCEVLSLCPEGVPDQGRRGRKIQQVQKKVKMNIRKQLSKQEPKDELQCQVCEIVVYVLDQLVSLNATDEYINSTMFETCDALPDPALQGICKFIVPQVINVFEKGVKPDAACKAIKLCSDSKKDDKQLDVLLKFLLGQMQMKATGEATEVNGDLECELCEDVIAFLDRLVGENETDAKINATLYQICDSLPTVYKNMCGNIIPQIMTALVNGVDPKEGCTDIGLCTGTNGRNYATQFKSILDQIHDDTSSKKVNDDIECELCEAVIAFLDRLVAENTTDTKINATLYQICDSLPAEIKATCLGIVPKIMSVLEAGVDPKEACTEISLCSGQGTEKYEDLFKSILDEMKVKLASDSVNADLECELCEALIAFLDRIVGENATDAQINATLYQICDSLPQGLQATCEGIIPQIMTVITTGVDPQAACTAAKLCTGQKAELQLKPNNGNDKADLPCDLCKAVIEEVDYIVEQNATKAQVNTSIYEQCARMQPIFQDICLEFAPDVVSVVTSGVDPKEACKEISLCSASVDVEVAIEPVKDVLEEVKVDVEDSPNDLECELCEDLITEIDKYIDNNSTIEKINTTIYTACMQLPGSIQDMCLQLAPQLVSIIAGGADPKTACEAIGVCTKQAIVSEDEPIPEEVQNMDSECELCEVVVEKVYRLIKGSGSEVKLNKIISGACGQYTGFLHDMCVESAPALVKAIQEGTDPKQICKHLQICKTPDVKLASMSIVKPLSVLDCDACIHALGSVHGEITKDFTKIQRPLSAICNQLPPQYKNKCLMLVNNNRYMKQFLDMYTPSELCELARCGPGWENKGDNLSK